MFNVCRKHGSPELPSTTPQRAGEIEVDQENVGLMKPEQALCLILEVDDDDDDDKYVLAGGE